MNDLIAKLSTKELLSVPCETLKQIFKTDDDINALKMRFFDYYRAEGFPYPEISFNQIKNDYVDLLNFKTRDLTTEDMIITGQNKIGIAVINSFHPHMWGVKCRSNPSPKELFGDDESFMKVISEMLIRSSNFKPSTMFNALRTFNHAQAVSNFRPTIAKFIYQNYCPIGGRVLDPCMGYGGRLFGVMASHVASYTASDPAVETVTGNRQLIKVMNEIIDALNGESLFSIYKLPEIEINQLPFEDYEAGEDIYDLVFTSPPYFNVEKYSYEDTQSWVRYKTFREWKSGFLGPLIQKSHKALKMGGFFILNIAGDNIIREALTMSSLMFGAGYSGKLKMQMAQMFGTQTDKRKKKIEPILIFQKKEG